MGSAFPKDPDPARVEYRKHNIYLNFLETYGRLDPLTPVTLHQKALFTFWMSTIFLWTLLKFRKMLMKLSIKRKCDEVKKESPPTPTTSKSNAKANHVIDIQKQPSKNSVTALPKKAWTTSELFVNQSKQYMPSRQDIYTETLTELNSDLRKVELKEVMKQTEGKIADEMSEGNSELGMSKEENHFLGKLKRELINTFTAHDKDQPLFEEFVFKLMIFGCFIFYFFLTDFLRIWPKVDKQYSRDMFVFLFFLLVFTAFVFTIKSTKDKLLNRDQTEEWKGWMQVQFVWYHYYDAQETFNSIRCYVGAYVWMTGFGNFIYFYTKKDYTIFRLLKMLFRLNFLVFCVMAVTSHMFVRYYICAMHTYWFLSVWAVMVAFNRYNDRPKFIYLKFFIYALVNAMIFNIPGASEKVFAPFKWALMDHDGTLRYWKYRSWLDHWSTLVGMIIAFHYTHIETILKYMDKDDPKTKSKRETLRYTITAILMAIFAAWFYFILYLPKEEYLAVHPFTSPIPIVIYTWMRNLHPFLRTHYLNLFTWLGKITLETYLSQIHIYMMGDAKAILVYLPRYPMLNFVIATLSYVAVSYALFHMTVFFSSYIFPRNGHVVIKNIIVGVLWLLTCYVIAFALTHEYIWQKKRTGLEFLRWNITKF